MDDELLKLLVLQKLLEKSTSEENESPKTVLLDVGLKVVRGPDWKWGEQDSGEGHVGTVVEIGESGTSFDKQVYVQWDSGLRSNYRVGCTGAYDLRTLENSSLGIKHPTVTCNSCRKKGVIGMRWKCSRCYDYDLCTRCYMSDKHDLTHPFVRIQTNNRNSVNIPKRQGAVKIQMKGIFSSAKVVRASDWKWDNQDGGAGKGGLVTDVCGWDDDSEWNACHVTWSESGSQNLYRIGKDGKMDLKYVEEAVDGYYYRDHLPVLGDETRTVQENSETPKVKEVHRSESIRRTDSKDDTKEIGSYRGRDLLSKNLKDLFFSDQLTDLTIKVKDRRFQVHKAILCARSSAFASKILHGTRNSSTLEVTDCEPDILEDVLFYLYTGKLKRLSHATVSALFRVADKFDIQGLKDECTRFTKEGLSADYISEFVAVA